MSLYPLVLGLSDQLDDLALSPFYAIPSSSHPWGVPSHSSLVPLLRDLQRSRRRRDNTAVANVGKDGFQVCMDVQQFKPSELSVKVVDNCIVVEGKHEEREDQHGFIYRHFKRRYVVPKDYDAEKLVSTLSSDGVLTVSIPKPAALENKPKERIVQIQQTGPAHLNVKQNEQEPEKAGGDK